MSHVLEWLRTGQYLPAPLRDFHDQKELFKTLWENVSRKQEHYEKETGRPYLPGLSWVDAQIFTIDQFLWFMAVHGWTLQRSRKPFEFSDLDAAVKDRRDRETAAFRKMMDERLKPAATQLPSPSGEKP